MLKSTRMPQLTLTIAVVLLAQPADAHHVMGGAMPVTWLQGLLSGLGHPIIGLDHFAAVIAVGCLAAGQRASIGLLAAFVLAMMAGATMHVRGATVPGAEILVALSVIALGGAIQMSKLGFAAIAILFVLAGLINGYALGESIAGAQPAPLYAYFAGLAVVQLAVATIAMGVARGLGAAATSVPFSVRIAGVAVVVVGLGAAALQLASAA